METYTVKVNTNGGKFWYQDDELHRTDGPAIEYANGNKHWYQNGKRHRTDGPAVECVNGGKLWYQDDKLHRTDGPAIEFASGDESWFIKGKEYTKKEFDAIVNVPKVKELTMSEISKLLGYEVKVVEG